LSDVTQNANATAVEEDDEVPTVGKWIDGLDEEEANDVVFILSQVDPLDVRLNAQQRELVLQARKVWQATGL
jgi:hypothetical protein